MKHSYFVFRISVLLAVATAILSCSEEDRFHFTSGTPVQFSVGAGGSAAETKTVYADSHASGLQNINWEVGDMVRIYCGAVSEPESKYADYRVEEVEPSNNVKAHIQVCSADGIGLRWGSQDETHDFYAVYPSPMTEGKNEDVFATVSEKTKLTGHIPADQSPLSVSTSAPYTAVPNLTSQYMIAKRSIDAGTQSISSDEVFLKFKPLTTAIQFTVQNNTAKDGDDGTMYISAVSVVSDATRINGGFTTDLAADGWTAEDTESSSYPACTATTESEVTDADKENKVNFTTPLELKKSETLTFTVFLLPAQDISDLSFKIYRQDKSGGNKNWLSTKLAYNDADKTGVTFPCHKISYISGILLPDGARWQVKYDDSDVISWGEEPGHGEPATDVKPEVFVTKWNSGVEEDMPLDKYNYTLKADGAMDFEHDGAESASINISSAYSLSSGSNYPAEWILQYWDDNAAAWTPAQKDSKIDGFVTFTSDVTGTGNSTLNFKVDAAEPSAVTHPARLGGATPKGSTDAPYDLSLYDIYGNLRAAGAVTANSYVISAPGTYAIPMVYGNAIDFTRSPAAGINKTAFNPGASSSDTETFLSRFKNANGTDITSPFIENDFNGVFSASVLWSDFSGIISDISVLTAAEAEGKGLTACSCGYIVFTVSSEGLTQGNTVIALKSAGTTVWSWHIWVTDDDLNTIPVRNASAQTLNMLPVNLGWKDEGNEVTAYPGAMRKFRIVQPASDETREFTITRQPALSESTTGSSLMYQWGRKDPFAEGKYSIYAVESSPLHVQDGISNPDKFIPANGGGNSWASPNYYNLWNATVKQSGASVIAVSPVKTIYDPCPPGFKVPQGNAFTGFTRNGAASSSSSDWNVPSGESDVESVPGHHFYTAGWKTGKTIFFPINYWITPDGGVFKEEAKIINVWTATTYSNDDGYYFSSKTDTGVNPLDFNGRANGGAVRPVKE